MMRSATSVWSGPTVSRGRKSSVAAAEQVGDVGSLGRRVTHRDDRDAAAVVAGADERAGVEDLPAVAPEAAARRAREEDAQAVIDGIAPVEAVDRTLHLRQGCAREHVAG